MSLRIPAAGLLAIVLISLAGAPAGADMQAIRIATTKPPPVEASAPAGDLSGFEAELAAAICQRVPTKCDVFVADAGDPLVPLYQWKADAVIAGLSVTRESQHDIDFSRAYASLSHGFAVMPGRLADLPGAGETLSLSTDPADATAMIAALRTAFAGKILAAAPGTPDLAFLQEHFGDVATVPGYVGSAEFESDISAGRIDAVMAPLIGLNALVAEPAFRQLQIAGPRFQEDDILGFGIAVGLRKSERGRHDMVDRAIGDMIRDGSLMQLSLKWFALDVTPHHCGCKPF